MAATNFTPISLYYSTTASAVPSAGNLVAGELALNTLDEKLYFKNSAGTVKLLASNAASTGTVSSVAATVPAFLSIAGSPITTSGTLAITLSGTALPVANGGTGVTTSTGTGSVVLSASPTFTGTVSGVNITVSGSYSATGGGLQFQGSGATTGNIYSQQANSTTRLLYGVESSAGATLFTGSSAYAGVLGVNSAYSLQFATNNTVRFTIGSAGEFGIASGTYGTAGQVLTSGGSGAAPTWTTPASGGGSFSAKTTNYTAVSGDNILANTSAGSWTLTLPASPSTGNSVQVMDSIGTFGPYPLTVARNGSTIMSAAENMILDVNGAATTFVYNGSTWRVI
jgi:hypothetical protein